jgi:hypothetical protein
MLSNIKSETRLWIAAGAKHLSFVILGESNPVETPFLYWLRAY